MTLLLQNAVLWRGLLNMEKIDPLYPKTRIFMPKIDPFFENRGHTKSTKKDPFSAKIRTMMRTYL